MGKISSKTILASSLLTAVSVSPSCGKYDDGPGFSLASKKSRLTGTWELDKLKRSNGSLENLNVLSIDIEFEKDGDYNIKTTRSYTNSFGNIDRYTYFDSGEWEFSSDKEELEFDPSDSGDYEWEIDRLTNKQLWIEDEYGNEYKWEKSNF